LDKSDFVKAGKSLQGSRDVGSQLFCALLRSVGVEARLVCSLQPLACVFGAPTMPKQREKKPPAGAASRTDVYRAAQAEYESRQARNMTASPRRRLGHPNAAAYHIPSLEPPPPSRKEPPLPNRVRGESPFPVYWVEVLDVAYQKWQPVDPLVTCTQWQPRAFEPPASDRENCMSYVMAFEADGSAKDVTRRYAKAYNSKTRKMRIDGLLEDSYRSAAAANAPDTVSGLRWWRKVMRVYRKSYSDVPDQIEETELAAEVTKEPMPRNVADFKDHPVFALERHLRRNEVIVPGAQFSGTVGAGSKGLVEMIYRRRDVRVARSSDKWYRLGRLVKDGEGPVKFLPKRPRRKSMFNDDDDDPEEDDPDKVGLFGDGAAGVPVFTLDQTELYEPPPVVDGVVPKNKFKNIDVYVPSMVPRGGVHINHERAAQAAYVCGVDYAPALTGFSFKGRHGTAVLSGAVVPAEAEEGVRAVIDGFADLEVELERNRRSLVALRMWSRFLKALRIRERIWANVDPAELQRADGHKAVDKGKGIADDEDDDGHDNANASGNVDEDVDVDIGNAPSDVSEEFFMGEDDEGGGFLIE
jgi:xeroderma pigmentosum group C-complementing protein